MGEKLMNVAIKDGMNLFERAIKRFFDIFCSFIPYHLYDYHPILTPHYNDPPHAE